MSLNRLNMYKTMIQPYHTTFFSISENKTIDIGNKFEEVMLNEKVISKGHTHDFLYTALRL